LLFKRTEQNKHGLIQEENYGEEVIEVYNACTYVSAIE
jgi:hypothetical protein